MRTFYHQNWIAERLMVSRALNDMLPEPLEKAKQGYESLLEQDEDDNEDEQGEELALGCALKSKCSCD